MFNDTVSLLSKYFCNQWRHSCKNSQLTKICTTYVVDSKIQDCKSSFQFTSLKTINLFTNIFETLTLYDAKNIRYLKLGTKLDFRNTRAPIL